MGLFSWLSGLFGRKKAKIPERVVEFRNRPRAKSAASAPDARDRDYAPQEEPVQQSASRTDYFDLAGDRAERERSTQSEAPAPEPQETEYEIGPSEEPASAPAYDIGEQEAVEPQEPEQASAPAPEDDYSPLDLAREIGASAPAPEVYQEPDYLKIDQTAGAISSEEPEAAPQTFAPPPAPEPEPEPEPAPAPAPAPEPAVRRPEPEIKEETQAVSASIDDEHALETLDVETVEGQGTVTIERKRIETKSINVAGEPFELALYEYQNGTKACRVPRAAIEKMTEVAKQNNLKVLPRRQNAAIMAGRYLDVPRSQLQELAEKEKYHLVDFTDTYYEICFGDLPEA